jgi:glycosyltransferase involved in cell wall biosynthesis
VDLVVTLVFGGSAVVCAGMALVSGWHLRWVRRLPPLAALPKADAGVPSDTPSPPCSIVIAARNEEGRIEQTVRRLLAQQGVEIELIVVDDRSTDETSPILQRLTKEDSRLRVIRIDQLPDGWLGKCHACHIGASTATGGWILFTDADCWSKPDMIDRAIRLANSEGVDHVTLTSGVSSTSLGLRAAHLAFVLSIANWFSGVNRDRPRAYMGIGAFNLVRAAAYRQCGGYNALRLTVLDDVKLGLLLRRAGKRTRAFIAGDDVECHWGDSIGSMIKVMEKNYFAMLEFRLWLALLVSGFVVFLMGAVVLGLIAQTALGLLAAASSLLLVVPAAILARRLGWSWHTALGVPFVMPVFLCALVNSTVVTLRQGGVRWRDTLYSLETLRAGGVR